MSSIIFTFFTLNIFSGITKNIIASAIIKGVNFMAKKASSKKSTNQFKSEAAKAVGVNLKQGYNGDLTAKQAGSIGGQMAKKMIESYENNSK